MENVGIFYVHFVYFTAIGNIILYILWSFGKFFPILVYCTKKNLATLIHTNYLLFPLFSGNEDIFGQNFGKYFFHCRSEYLCSCFCSTDVFWLRSNCFRLAFFPHKILHQNRVINCRVFFYILLCIQNWSQNVVGVYKFRF
jgi:hypothetical protein